MTSINPSRPAAILTTLVLLLSCLAALPARAAESAAQRVVVHLSHYTDDLHAASMALALAGNLADGDADVTLFLDLEGVRLADRRLPEDFAWGSGPKVPERLEAFVEAGGRVILCAHCAEGAGIGSDVLRPGARIGTDAQVQELFLEADKVIDF